MFTRKRGRKPKQQIVKQQVRPLTFFYEDFGSEIRWWNNTDPGDMFDILFSREQLKGRIDAARALGIRVVDHLPGFCSEMDKCPDHLGYH